MENIRLQIRGGKLYARYKEKGEWRKKSLNIVDTVENREYALQVLVPRLALELASGRKRNTPKTLQYFMDIVLAEAMEKKPATAKTYEHAARVVFSFFGKNKNIADIDIEDIDAFIREMKKTGLKASTIQVYLAPLSLALKEAKRIKMIAQNPVEDAKVPAIKTKEKIPFTVEAMEKMIAAADGKLKRYLMIAFYTGARVGEIVSLRWSDYNTNTKSIEIERTRMLGDYNLPKSGKKRTIPAMEPLVDFLESTNSGERDSLIVGYTEAYQANADLKKLQVEIGLADSIQSAKSTHYIRHTTASIMFAARENPMLIRDMLGHVDFDMLNKTYGHYLKNENDFAGFCKLINTKAG